jgi:hypothetical protein
MIAQIDMTVRHYLYGAGPGSSDNELVFNIVTIYSHKYSARICVCACARVYIYCDILDFPW